MSIINPTVPNVLGSINPASLPVISGTASLSLALFDENWTALLNMFNIGGLPSNPQSGTLAFDTNKLLWIYGNGAWNQITGILKVKVQVFNSSGTYTPSSGLLYAIVEVVSGGGGGGAGDATPHSGGGGGGGGYARAILTAATIGASQTVTIGNGGAGGIYGGIGAAPGGTTSFGSYLSATGGGGGNPIIGGLGGVGLGGSVNCSGSPGANEMGTSNIAGDGGSSMMGGGGKGSYGTTNAMQGGNYGGGGGGGGAVASYGNGNNGAPGIVIVTEFKTQ